LLLRRIIDVAEGLERPTLEERARSMRDCSRAAELVTDAIDALVSLGGTAGYGASHPLQRAWRDIHFASCHISLNPEINFGYWGGVQLGVERPASQAVY
jgi:alkylation response protein AidB-like acyl-CoA dehydrogenase